MKWIRNAFKHVFGEPLPRKEAIIYTILTMLVTILMLWGASKL